MNLEQSDKSTRKGFDCGLCPFFWDTFHIFRTLGRGGVQGCAHSGEEDASNRHITPLEGFSKTLICLQRKLSSGMTCVYVTLLGKAETSKHPTAAVASDHISRHACRDTFRLARHRSVCRDEKTSQVLQQSPVSLVGAVRGSHNASRRDGIVKVVGLELASGPTGPSAPFLIVTPLLVFGSTGVGPSRPRRMRAALSKF